MSDKILAFVPCYNCAPQIGRVLAQFQGEVAGYVDEVLLLDNGSKDGTVDAAITAAPVARVPKVTIGRNRANYNLGGSHKVAFAHAAANGFSHVIILHGDDQGSLPDLLPVLTDGSHRRFDACLGARFARSSRLQGYSRFRIFGNKVFNLFFTAVAGKQVLDLGSGLNLVNRTIFTDPGVTSHADDLRFNVYLLLHMIDRDREILFFPISWREDDQISNVRMMSQARRTLAIAAEYALKRQRFRNADHRDVQHPAYGFDPVAQFAGGARVG
jgi:glycosyltransferase involved in cell wall biosynthesis